MVIMHVWYHGTFRRNCRQNLCETFFFPFRVFLFSRNSFFRRVVRFFGIFGLVGPGILAHPLVIWFLRLSMLKLTLLLLLSVGQSQPGIVVSGPGLGGQVWLLFGRQPPRSLLILVMRVLGVTSMRGAPVSLPTFATAQFQRFFDCGRAVRCMQPVASGRFMHPVVLHGYQGADSDAEPAGSAFATLACFLVVCLGQ